MHDPIKPAPLPPPAISIPPGGLSKTQAKRSIQHLIEQRKQHGCFCSKSAAKDPAVVAGLADPQPSDRVSQIAASSSGPAAHRLAVFTVISENYQLPLPLSWPCQPPPSATIEARTYHVIMAILLSSIIA
jgi:hypothetical protein